VATVAVAVSASGAQGPTAKAGLTVGERAFPFTIPLVLPSLSYYEMLRWNIVRDVAVSLVPICWFHTSICSDSVACPTFLMSPSRKSALSVSKAWITFVNLNTSLKLENLLFSSEPSFHLSAILQLCLILFLEELCPVQVICFIDQQIMSKIDVKLCLTHEI
jgi:hypothetical protein